MSPSCLSPQAVVEGPVISDARETALSYASRGWPVFPVHSVDPAGRCSCGRADCQDPGKHPRTDHGFKDASTDEAPIGVWWSIWPDANVGIATGALSGLVVIDVDEPEIPEVLRGLLGTEAERIPTVRTGGEGLHLYFRHPGEPVASRVRVLDLPGRRSGGRCLRDRSAQRARIRK